MSHDFPYDRKDPFGNIIEPMFQWINGVKMMVPAPAPNHGKTLSRLNALFDNYLFDKQCELFADRTDLILKNPSDSLTVKELKQPVQPDLFVFCEHEFEWIDNSIIGIPDFILEVVSPGSWRLDTYDKKNMYLKAGVKEYWVVDYNEKFVLKYYRGAETKYTFEEKVKVEVLENLVIDFQLVEKALLKRKTD